MDVLMGQASLRTHSRHRPMTSSSQLLTSSSDHPTSSNHPQTSSLDGWAESIDLLRVARPDYSPSLVPSSPPSGTLTRPTPSASEVSEVKPEVVRVVTSSSIVPRNPLSDPQAPSLVCRACCQQDEATRHPGGVYYHHPYHQQTHRHPNNPYCRACIDAATSTPVATKNPEDQSSIYFNYLKCPTGGIKAPQFSPYSTNTLLRQLPYARVGQGQGSGEGEGVMGCAPGQRPVARNPSSSRRRLLRFAPDLWHRLSRSSPGFGGGAPPPGTSTSRSRTGTSMVDPRVVETKAEAFVDGSGKTGRGGIAMKNRGDGDFKTTTFRGQRWVFIGAFLLAVFVMAAASVLGIVVMWTPRQRTASSSSSASSLATDLARSQNAINSNHVTEGDVDDNAVRYITVIPSLVKASTDDMGWAFYARGSAKGSKYTVVNKPMSFYSAQEHCQKLGGYLVHVNSLREQLFLEDFLTQELEKQGPSHDSGVGFWMGAKRARGSHEGTCMFEQWKWVDAYGRALSAIAGLTAFIPGKPDNQYNPEECLFISYKERTDENRFLKWDDAPCDLNSIGSIKALCEVEIR